MAKFIDTDGQRIFGFAHDGHNDNKMTTVCWTMDNRIHTIADYLHMFNLNIETRNILDQIKLFNIMDINDRGDIVTGVAKNIQNQTQHWVAKIPRKDLF